jgi:hypothetical protein
VKIPSLKNNKTIHNIMYNQLLYLPVLASKVSFSTYKVGSGKLLKAVVSGYRCGTEDATASRKIGTGYTRGR